MIVGMFLTVIPVVGMVVDGFMLTVNVCMGVAMRMHMGVYQISMPVLVVVNMVMFMGVLQTDGILDHKNSCKDHNDQTYIELNAGTLAQQQDTESHAQEGCDGVIGAGLGSTQNQQRDLHASSLVFFLATP